MFACGALLCPMKPSVESLYSRHQYGEILAPHPKCPGPLPCSVNMQGLKKMCCFSSVDLTAFGFPIVPFLLDAQMVEGKHYTF